MATEPKSAKPFACSQCFDSFATKFGLIAHMRRHSKPNPKKRRRDPADGIMGQTQKEGDGAEDADEFTCRGCHKLYKYYSSYLTHLTKCRKYDGWKKSKEQQEQQQRVAQLGGASASGAVHDDLALGETPIPFGSGQAHLVPKGAVAPTTPSSLPTLAVFAKRVLPESPPPPAERNKQEQHEPEPEQAPDQQEQDEQPLPPTVELNKPDESPHLDELANTNALHKQVPPMDTDNQTSAAPSATDNDKGKTNQHQASRRALPTLTTMGAVKTKRTLPEPLVAPEGKRVLPESESDAMEPRPLETQEPAPVPQRPQDDSLGEEARVHVDPNLKRAPKAWPKQLGKSSPNADDDGALTLTPSERLLNPESNSGLSYDAGTDDAERQASNELPRPGGGSSSKLLNHAWAANSLPTMTAPTPVRIHQKPPVLSASASAARASHPRQRALAFESGSNPHPYDGLPHEDRQRSAPHADRAYVKTVDYFSRLFDENCTMRARYAAEFIHFNLATDTKNTNTWPLDVIPNKVLAYLKANNLMV